MEKSKISKIKAVLLKILILEIEIIKINMLCINPLYVSFFSLLIGAGVLTICLLFGCLESL